MTVGEYEELYRATAPQLFAYLRRRGRDDPEDVVAEVFAIAWRRRDELPAPALRRAWLFGAARNLGLAENRRRGHEHIAATRLAAQHGPTAAAGDQEVAGAVRAALDRLSPDVRELVTLVEWDRLSPMEASVALGISPGAARVRLHRARQLLASDPHLIAFLSHRHPDLVGPSTLAGSTEVPVPPA